MPSTLFRLLGAECRPGDDHRGLHFSSFTPVSTDVLPLLTAIPMDLGIYSGALEVDGILLSLDSFPNPRL